MSSQPAIELAGITRAYGNVRAVDDISLSVEPGEFFAMLGPSGSGKTTCLRLIAGFESPDRGRIRLAGADVTDMPPYDRDVNTVFQDYALFPHMSVIDNVAYGPRVRRVARAARLRRAAEMLQLVKLAELAGRRPAQLSGGQRQRVALARALINQPRVLLLDEPLGALDLQLREQMQVELKSLQRRLGITFVFVTHDQNEALSMADRVAVFNHGRIEQLADPRSLYARPATSFVARFVGAANVAEGAIARELSGLAQAFAVRAEHVRLIAPGQPVPEGEMTCTGTVVEVLFHGASSRIQIELADGTVFSAALGAAADPLPQVGMPVGLAWQREHAIALQGGVARVEVRDPPARRQD